MSKKKKPMSVTEFAKLGGLARKKSLSPEARSLIAKKASMRRWGNRDPLQYLPYER